ncbi:hypothetical protein CELL_00073 [Cellulomonas sp. T2.31MG-18]|uniref:hypothetical protein n=1 Tax=Cellulomonas sp. T2.31MG-18 TaxID=3157619 RepID=UPI0035E6CB6E
MNREHVRRVAHRHDASNVRAFGSVAARPRSRWRTAAVAALVVVPVNFTPGCNQVGGEGTFKVCGQALLTAPDMPLVWDVSAGPSQIHDGGLVLLRLTQDCAKGVDVTVVPATAAQVTARAKADDGRTAGMVLSPTVHQFRLVSQPATGSPYSVEIDDSTRSPS